MKNENSDSDDDLKISDIDDYQEVGITNAAVMEDEEDDNVPGLSGEQQLERLAN
jgi:hypothetical protein